MYNMGCEYTIALSHMTKPTNQIQATNHYGNSVHVQLDVVQWTTIALSRMT